MLSFVKVTINILSQYSTVKWKLRIVNRAYYGYLAEVPENYKLTLDGKEVQVDWKELFYPTESAQE